MSKIVIFGAGMLGRCALEYFKNEYDIAFFVDNDRCKWGTEQFGYEIRNPIEIIENDDICIVVPVNKYFDEICQQIGEMGKVSSIIAFEVQNKIHYLTAENNSESKDEKIVSFKGGIGNQLFQYSFYLLLEQRGDTVKADVDYYYESDSRPFVLNNVFPDISINTVARGALCKKICYKTFLEPNVRTNYGEFPSCILENFEYQYYDGYFQTYKIPDRVKPQLLKKYNTIIAEKSISSRLLGVLKNANTVSVHVRRGDYTLPEIRDIYMGICDANYYNEAINLINERIENPLYIIFSDDIDWVKENITISNVIYAKDEITEKNCDWIELMIMSMCKHNIIANSSFSWWGAWLNQNPEKSVIAPSKWVNYKSQLDMCPPEWIRV